jgi:hypothetical protein
METFELTITAEIRQIDGGYGGLRVNETVKVDAKGFLELTAILSRFHDLAQTFKSEKK